MNQTVKQHALIVVTLVLTLLALVLLMFDPLSVSGQVNRRWNPRRVPADTVFLGDQVCLDCHKKFASFGHSGMAMAMEQVGGSKILNDNPQLTMRVGAYSYHIKRDGKQSFYSVTDGKDTISQPSLQSLACGTSYSFSQPPDSSCHRPLSPSSFLAYDTQDIACRNKQDLL